MLAASKVKVCGSDKIRKTYNISSLKRVTRKFLKVSQTNLQKGSCTCIACVQTSSLPQKLREGGRLYTDYTCTAFFVFLLTRPIVVVFIVLVVFTISLALFEETIDI